MIAVVASAAAPAFAAPGTSVQVLPAAGAVPQIGFALLGVLAAIFALAWLLRRLRMLQGDGDATIRVLGQTALGARERAVLLEVEDRRVLVGVCTGAVSTLLVLEPRDPRTDAADERPGSPATLAPPATPAPRFADLLKRSLGR